MIFRFSPLRIFLVSDAERHAEIIVYRGDARIFYRDKSINFAENFHHSRVCDSKIIAESRRSCFGALDFVRAEIFFKRARHHQPRAVGHIDALGVVLISVERRAGQERRLPLRAELAADWLIFPGPGLMRLFHLGHKIPALAVECRVGERIVVEADIAAARSAGSPGIAGQNARSLEIFRKCGDNFCFLLF